MRIMLLLLSSLMAGPVLAAQTSSLESPITNGDIETGFPSVVSLARSSGGNLYSFCTGSLIAPRVVLTAAHCLYGTAPSEVSSWRAYLGPDVTQDGITRRITDIVPHPDYEPAGNPSLDKADIGVVLLKSDVDVQPLRYRQKILTEYELCPNGGCTRNTDPLDLMAVGFGTTDSVNGSGTKRSTLLTVGGFGSLYGKSDDYIITVDQLSNTCPGDSGGPMFFDNDGVWNQWGVHSWGGRSQCAAGQGGSTRVDIYTDWINEQVAKEHSGTPDLCTLNNFYDDAVCDDWCQDPDPDCPSSCKAQFLPKQAPWLWLLLLLPGLRRRRWDRA